MVAVVRFEYQGVLYEGQGKDREEALRNLRPVARPHDAQKDTKH